MVVSDTGLSRIVALVTGDLEDGRAGTGTTAPTAADTDLVTPVAGTESDVTSVQNTAGFTVTHLVTSAQGNGSDLSEWQIRMNSEATQLHRVVTAPISKTAALEITKLTVFVVLGE